MAVWADTQVTGKVRNVKTQQPTALTVMLAAYQTLALAKVSYVSYDETAQKSTRDVFSEQFSKPINGVKLKLLFKGNC